MKHPLKLASQTAATFFEQTQSRVGEQGGALQV